MTEKIDTTTIFQWHPQYREKTAGDVQRELAESIRRDQSLYREAMTKAEQEEHGTFAAIRDLEKRWGTYDFDWSDADADALATRITAFELARDDREELFLWSEWRSAHATPRGTVISAADTGQESRDWRENLTDQQRQRIASAMAALVMVVIFAVIGGLLWLIFT